MSNGMNDPLLKASSDPQRELFQRFSNVGNGFSTEVVLGAAVNLLINAIRQQYPTKNQAEVRFDELFGQLKQVLLNHYDSVGRKKGIFPYTQTIEGSLFNPRDEFNKN